MKAKTNTTDKTKTYKMRGALTLFAVLGATVILSVTAGPALAAKPGLVDPSMTDLTQEGLADILDRLEDDSDFLDIGHVVDLRDLLGPDLVIPDMGGEEMVEPDDTDEEAVVGEDPDGGGDEAIEEEPAEPGDEGDDEAVVEEADAADDAADEAIEEEAEDVVEDEATVEQEDTDDNDGSVEELAFTGGDNLPWLIAGAAVILAGIALIVGLARRPRKQS